MPPLPLTLAVTPGVNTQGTPLVVGAGITQSSLIRFRDGYTQKRGGCLGLNQTPFSGIARCLFAWEDNIGNPYLAVGTNFQLLAYFNYVARDVSPVAHTSNLSSGALATMMNSSIVTVTDGAYSPVVGQSFSIVNVTVIAGLYLQGEYQVVTVGSGTFTFDAGASANATSTSTNFINLQTFSGSPAITITLSGVTFAPFQSVTLGVGIPSIGDLNVIPSTEPVHTTGTHAPFISGYGIASGNAGPTAENSSQTRINYLLALPQEGAVPVGFGLGPYGVGPYGYGQQTGGLPYALIEWSMCAWGEDLLAAYAGGTIYTWTPPVTPEGNLPFSPATPLANAPSIVNGIFIAAPQQQVFAWGAFSATLNAQDPLLLAWCDVADDTDWTATATNQAGTFRLSSGNRIVSGTWFGIVGLLWTDADLWLVTYLGFPLVYGFNRISVSCGLISPRAWAILGTRFVWMSQNDFFIYQNGQSVTLPCSVRDFIFKPCQQNNFTGLDRSYINAIHADANTWFGEVVWRFPTVGSNGVCNAYVCWNISGQWDIYFGPQVSPFVPPEISAWVDQPATGTGVNAPIGSDYTGLLQQFETANDFNGQVLDSSFMTGWFQVAEGAAAVFLDQILPDFVLLGGSGGVLPGVQMTIFVSDFLPMENASYPVRTYGPYPITSTTAYITPRASGRFVRLLIENVVANTFWRYGKPLVVGVAEDRR